ncbi:hypothetical protein M9458_043200 [Cirrhinus mrigala]|uniref:MADF domain-containing protein n=1 Tax=Cirrhinus mrigala TaxID=683832 RepID=A0ABD0ND92_CIRMR
MRKLPCTETVKMAARSDAAATPGPNDGAFMSFNVVRSSPNSVNVPLKHRESTPKQIYDRQSLLEIGNAHKHQLSPAAIEKLRGLCILLKPDLETVASPSDAIRTKRQRERGRKRGKRGGIRARLRANPTGPALPTLMLSNVRSLEDKLDEIQLSQSTEHEARDCCVFVFTETWLNDKTPDSAIQLHGLTGCRADRDSSLSGKTRGGGLCVYINKEWCNNAAVVTKNCSSLVEFMFVKCRPFYLPREFTAIVIVAVYIPPCANANGVLPIDFEWNCGSVSQSGSLYANTVARRQPITFILFKSSKLRIHFKMEEKLIIAVGNHPVLYDQSLFMYRDSYRRDQAWKEVAEAVGESGVYWTRE